MNAAWRASSDWKVAKPGKWQAPGQPSAVSPNELTTARKPQFMLVTAPMAALEEPNRLKVRAIRGGWKPKMSPTPKLEEKTAANPKRREVGSKFFFMPAVQ